MIIFWGLSDHLTCQVFHTTTNLAVVNESVYGVFYFNKNECTDCIYQISICDKDGNLIASQHHAKEGVGLKFSFHLKGQFKTGLYFLACSPYESNEVYALKPIVILNPEEKNHLKALADDLYYQEVKPSELTQKTIKIGSYDIKSANDSSAEEHRSISITDLSQSPILNMEVKEGTITTEPTAKSLNVSGLITTEGYPLKNTLISINSTKDSLDFRYTMTDGQGYFEFSNFTYYGSRTFNLNHFSENEVKEVEVNIDSLQKLKIPDVKVYTDSIWIQDAVRLKLLSHKVDFTFQKPSKKPIWNIEEKKPLTNYNQLIKMEDFVAFPTMTRVIKEIVPFVKTKDSTLNVFSTEINRTLPNAPLLFVDGVINTPEEVLQLDVSSIKFIEVVNQRKELARYGRLGHGGVISIVRKEMHSGTFQETISDQNTFEHRGFSKPSVFKPKEKTEIKPYFPSTLIWYSDETHDRARRLNFILPDYSTRLLVTITTRQSNGSININQEILHFEK